MDCNVKNRWCQSYSNPFLFEFYFEALDPLSGTDVLPLAVEEALFAVNTGTVCTARWGLFSVRTLHPVSGAFTLASAASGGPQRWTVHELSVNKHVLANILRHKPPSQRGQSSCLACLAILRFHIIAHYSAFAITSRHLVLKKIMRWTEL